MELDYNSNMKLKLAIVSPDLVGKKMAGVGIRYFEFAKSLCKDFQVTLFAPSENQAMKTDFKINQPDQLLPEINKFNIILAPNLKPNVLAEIAGKNIKFILDLYDPVLVENLEHERNKSALRRAVSNNFQISQLKMNLLFANHVLCATDRQKKYYQQLFSDFKINDDLEKFITLAPFGLRDKNLKMLDQDAVYKKFPALKKTDKIVYWGGGVWNWFDTMSAIKSIEILSQKRNDIKLVFLGAKHPNSKIGLTENFQEAYKCAEEKKLVDKFIFFNFDWTPYEERVNYLGIAKIGLSTHFDNQETELSFRTRILDYLWADLPLVITKGDFFAELCQQKNLGLSVDEKKPNQIADAIEKIIDNPQLELKLKENISENKKPFFWSEISKSIIKVIKDENFCQRKVNFSRFNKIKIKYFTYGFLQKIIK